MMSNIIENVTNCSKGWSLWNRIGGGMGKLHCWCKGKGRTVRNGIVSEVKKLDCWYRSNKESQKLENRMELDIGMISKILDCTCTSISTPEDHIKLIKKRIEDAGLSDFHVEIFLNEYKIPNHVDHGEPRVAVQFKNIDFNITSLIDAGDIAGDIELCQIEYFDGPSAISLSFLFCSFNSRLSFNSIFRCRINGNGHLEFIECKSQNINFVSVFCISAFGAVALLKCSITEGTTVFLAEPINSDSHSNSSDLPIIKKQISIEIIDSRIDNLRIDASNRKIDSFFREKNIFKHLASSGYNFDLFYWGGYQQFSTSDDDVFLNRKFFLALNKNDVIQNDAFQLLTIQKELAKCHHAILRSEGKLSQQDRMLFWLSEIISYHGTCWVTNLTWIFIFGLFTMILLDSLTSVLKPISCNSFLEIYTQLYNPFQWGKDLFSDEDRSLGTLFIFIHKFFSIVLYYELVKTLRRFGRANHK